MDKVTLSWIETSFDELQISEEGDFYVLSEGSRLSYIGIAYLQNIEQEVKQTIRVFGLKSGKYKDMVGKYYYLKCWSNYRRINQRF